jgi:hypothetical protein
MPAPVERVEVFDYFEVSWLFRIRKSRQEEE